MTIIEVPPATGDHHTIVYIEREDGDSERVAIFSGDYRSYAIAFGLRCERELETVLIVADDDVDAWPEILDCFESHTNPERVESRAAWRKTTLRMCR